MSTKNSVRNRENGTGIVCFFAAKCIFFRIPLNQFIPKEFFLFSGSVFCAAVDRWTEWTVKETERNQIYHFLYIFRCGMRRSSFVHQKALIASVKEISRIEFHKLERSQRNEFAKHVCLSLSRARKEMTRGF